MTATVHNTWFPDDLPVASVIDEDSELRERVLAIDSSRSVAYACPSSKPGRHAGVTAATIQSLHEAGQFDATYIKADGARMRWIKAPGEGEPMLPPGPDLVIPVVSAKAIGEPLSERVAHRPEQVAAITGVAPGRLLASDEGALKGTGGARVAPVINMVDNQLQEEMARAAAAAALATTSRFESVVLCCLRRPDKPIVAVVAR